MNIETNYCEIQPEQIYLHRIVSDFVIDSGVFDAWAYGPKILPEGIASHDAEEYR